MAQSQHAVTKAKNKSEMEFGSSLWICHCYQSLGLAFVCPLLPSGPAAFHHLVFLVMDIAFAQRKKPSTLEWDQAKYSFFFSQHCFQDLKSGRYRGPELLHEDRIDSVNQRENLLSGSQTFNLLLRIIRTPKSLCRPFLLDRYSHVLIFLLQK